MCLTWFHARLLGYPQYPGSGLGTASPEDVCTVYRVAAVLEEGLVRVPAFRWPSSGYVWEVGRTVPAATAQEQVQRTPSSCWHTH